GPHRSHGDPAGRHPRRQPLRRVARAADAGRNRQPPHLGARGASRHAAADPDDAQRHPDRCRRGLCRRLPRHPGTRRGGEARRLRRVSRAAGRADGGGQHGGRTPLPGADRHRFPRRLPGYRAEPALRRPPAQHAAGACRCRHPPRSAGGQRAHRTAHRRGAQGAGGEPGLSRPARHPAGTGGAGAARVPRLRRLPAHHLLGHGGGASAGAAAPLHRHGGATGGCRDRGRRDRRPVLLPPRAGDPGRPARAAAAAVRAAAAAGAHRLCRRRPAAAEGEGLPRLRRAPAEGGAGGRRAV
ncbi:MAG: Transcriptional regulator, LysR family, partial [uncultured Craurococcus sp.]